MLADPRGADAEAAPGVIRRSVAMTNPNLYDDHSLDGFLLVAAVVALLSILGLSLALRLAGRSWKLWHLPAMAVFFTWWAGVSVGHYGLRSVFALLSTLAAASLLFAPMRRTITAALSP